MTASPRPWREFPFRPAANWSKIAGRCVWCGDDFDFYSPLDEQGKPKRTIRYCSRACIGEARWEGKRKCPPLGTIRKLYVMEGWSMPRIAAKCGCAPGTIWRAMKAAGILAREYTSTRTCKKCGAPAEKTRNWRRSKDGFPVLAGALCLKHRREYHRDWARNHRRRKAPLGMRRPGRYPLPSMCPACERIHASARHASACHGRHVTEISRKFRLTLEALLAA